MSKAKPKIKPAPSVKQTAPAKEVPPLIDFIKGKEFYFAVLLIIAIAFFVFKDFLLFDKVFLYKDIGSDSLNGLYPPMRNVANYLHSSGLPSWSFKSGMGQNIFPFCLRDPFDIILYIAGKDSLIFGIGYIEFIKVIIGGTIFFAYLRTINMSGYVCIIGSLLYSFTGFMILGGGWYMFSYEAVNLALLLLAFEKLFKGESWYLFPIAIAGIVISMPFNLYVYGVFLFLYATLRFLEAKDRFNPKEYFLLMGKMISLGIFGLALSSFFLFENVLQLLESPRGSGENSYFEVLSSSPLFATGDLMQNATTILRMFSSDLMGTGSNFIGWGNYLEAPITYCGLISLVLLPQLFPTLNKRTKIIYTAFLLIWILPLLFPYFRYAFWLFTGDYYRAFGFFLALTFILFALKALNTIQSNFKINIPVLIGTIVILLGFLMYPYFDEMDLKPINSTVMLFVKFSIIAYAVLIYAMTRPASRKNAQLLLLLMVCVEAGYMSYTTVNKRDIVSVKDLSQKKGYNDYSGDAVAFLKKRDSSFYRIDKNYFSSGSPYVSYNDGMVQDYYGTSSYNSFNQLHYVLFLQAIKIADKTDEGDSRWAVGTNARPLLQIISNVKYFLDDKTQGAELKVTHDSIGHFGNVKVWKHKNALPFGFTYDAFVTRSMFDSMSYTQSDFTVLRAFVVDDNEKDVYAKHFKQLLPADTLHDSSFTTGSIAKFANERKADTLNVTSRGETYFNGTIELDHKKLLFLSIPFDKSWKAKVDGVEQDLVVVDAGMSGLILDKGTHSIELYFEPRMRTAGSIMSAVSLALFGLLLWRTRKQKKANSPE